MAKTRAGWGRGAGAIPQRLVREGPLLMFDQGPEEVRK